jgi:hypothetical protein
MAVTIAPLPASHSARRPDLRRISSNLQFRSVRALPIPVTADRRGRVGLPTIGDGAVDVDDRELDDRSETPMSDQPLPTPALVREAIDTALDSLDALEQQARDTARRFRRLAVDEAQQDLAQMVESTQTLLKLAVMTAGASGTDIETVCADHDIAAERDTQEALSALIGHQLAGDWHGLAGAIEQSFTAALGGWRAVFLALAGPTDPYGHAA